MMRIEITHEQFSLLWPILLAILFMAVIYVAWYQPATQFTAGREKQYKVMWCCLEDELGLEEGARNTKVDFYNYTRNELASAFYSCVKGRLISMKHGDTKCE